MGERRRLPGRVYAAGPDPDLRFSLANERTYLAWLRTALALFAGAVAVHAPALSLPGGLRTGLSLGLLALAGLCATLATRRWRRTEIALRSGGFLPGFAGPLLAAAGLIALIVAFAVVTVLGLV